jgi:hypothetical protein
MSVVYHNILISDTNSQRMTEIERISQIPTEGVGTSLGSAPFGKEAWSARSDSRKAMNVYSRAHDADVWWIHRRIRGCKSGTMSLIPTNYKTK